MPGQRRRPRLERLEETGRKISIATLVGMVEADLPDILKTMARAAKGDPDVPQQAITAGTAILNLVAKHLSEKADAKGKEILAEIRALREVALKEVMENAEQTQN